VSPSIGDQPVEIVRGEAVEMTVLGVHEAHAEVAVRLITSYPSDDLRSPGYVVQPVDDQVVIGCAAASANGP
jgi:hypothetical protein